MLAAYRQILTLPGAARFSGAALVARMPMAMEGLGIVLLVEPATGSYALAGSVSGTAVLANAVLAAPQGRWVDRHGQRRVVGVAASVWAVATAVLVTAVGAGWPVATWFVAAALAGLALPGVGSCVRARWVHVLDQPTRVQTAFALEAAADETVFMLGPVAATLLATTLAPGAGLGGAVLLGTVGTAAFLAQRSSEPPPRRPAAAGSGDGSAGGTLVMPWLAILPMATAGAALGVVFGSAEVTTVAFTGEHGSEAWAGPLLALWALGSLVAAVVTGTVAWQAGPHVRLRLGAAVLALTTLPLLVVPTPLAMAPVLLVGGLAIAPTLIALTSLVEQTVPTERLTEGMALVHTGVVAGVAPGASLAGLVVDGWGASWGYGVAFAGGALAAVAGLACRAPTTAPHPGVPAAEPTRPR